MLVALTACAKGGIADNGPSTFGFGTMTATAGMTSTDPTDATAGTGDPSDTDASTGGAEVGDSGSGEVGGEACGNGAIDGAEQCDGAQLGGADCVGAGYSSGALSCTVLCTLDTSGCVGATCGDGVRQDGELCDCGMAGGPCSAEQLGNQACNVLAAPTGGNYTGGTLGCTPQCAYDESACTACGDGSVDAGEACDGGDLAGQSCQSQGFDAGNLACSPSCAFNTGGCVTYVCGNGSCDPGEDSCSCALDCPDDPNTCGDPCQCGASGGACFCDLACLDFGDCCPNGPC